jgi:hypothetical protein
MIKMKALRSFGVNGSNEGKVKRGREISAANEHRARELEAAGLAYRIEAQAVMPQPVNQAVDPAVNAAAIAGPLGSRGGTIGGEPPAPSLLPDPPQRRRRSRSSRDESES